MSQDDRSRYLVTGAAGFIGAAVIDRLLDDPSNVVVGVDVMNDYYDPTLKRDRLERFATNPRFEFHELDCAEQDGMGAVFAKSNPEVVIHLAAQAGVRHSVDNPISYLHSNLLGFGVVLEAARRQSVDHFVYASSSSVYGETSKLPFSEHNSADHPTSLYAATKRANEMMAHSYSHLYGLSTTGLRFFSVYGPWGRPDMAYYAFAEAILDGRPLTLFGDGSAVRDFTFIDDVVEGVVRVSDLPAQASETWSIDDQDPSTSTAPFRVYNIGHGGQASVAQLIRLLELETGKTALIDQKESAAGDVPRIHATTDDLTALTGFTPEVPLEEGLHRFVQWLTAYRGTRRP